MSVQIRRKLGWLDSPVQCLVLDVLDGYLSTTKEHVNLLKALKKCEAIYPKREYEAAFHYCEMFEKSNRKDGVALVSMMDSVIEPLEHVSWLFKWFYEQGRRSELCEKLKVR